jgi:hypothetical protein
VPASWSSASTHLGIESFVSALILGRCRALPWDVAVLTKPDRIPSGEEGNWTLLLRNTRERYKHGWHCVKQPSSDDMRDGITWAEARDAELRFFAETEPWASLDADARGRLGTVPLTTSLGEILFALIAKR